MLFHMLFHDVFLSSSSVFSRFLEVEVFLEISCLGRDLVRTSPGAVDFALWIRCEVGDVAWRCSLADFQLRVQQIYTGAGAALPVHLWTAE